MFNTWSGLLVSQQGVGPALSNSTTPTSILLGQAKWVLAANWFEAAGKKLRIKAHGKISTAAATPGTLTLDVRFGSTVVSAFGASPTLATSITNGTFDLEADLTVQSVGSGTSATVLAVGKLITAANTALIQLLPATAPAAGSGFDSTVSFAIDVFATWSVASASNSIQTTDYELSSLN
jgi:hypothetical protein